MSDQTPQPDLSIKEQALFFIPLAMTSLMIMLTHAMFNAGLARLPSPEIMIAAFAVSKSLMHIFQSPTMMVRQTVSALIDHRTNFRKTTVFLMVVVFSVVLVLGTVAYTDVSRWMFRKIMGIDGQTLDEAVLMLRVLFLFPLFVSIRDYFAGFAIKFRTTPLITISSVVRISYVLIFISLLDKMTGLPGAYQATFMFIGALVMEAMTMATGTMLLNKNLLRRLERLDEERSHLHPTRLSYPNILVFFLPLFATTIISNVLMPIINSGLARTDKPELAISSFSVAWGLGMIVLSPFMMFHQVSLNFIEDPSGGQGRGVRKFGLLLAVLTSLILALIGFTDIGYYILTRWISATPEISILSTDVLRFMFVLPFLMVAREYYWGILMRRRTTKPILQGKAANVITLIVTIIIMTFIGPANPAINGVVGMIACETVEFLYLHLAYKRMERKNLLAV